MPVLAAIGVGGRAELDLEGDVFAKIAIRVEAKGVETFVAEGVGALTPAFGFTVKAITVVPGRPRNK